MLSAEQLAVQEAAEVYASACLEAQRLSGIRKEAQHALEVADSAFDAAIKKRDQAKDCLTSVASRGRAKTA
jgi:hypothetical protein